MAPYFKGFVMQFVLKKTRKVEKCSDNELETDVPQRLVSSLNLDKKNLILDLDYQNFEIQCYF